MEAASRPSGRRRTDAMPPPLVDAETKDCVWAAARVPAALHPWAMCTFDKRIDTWVSRRIQEGGCFECEHVDSMLQIMKAHRRGRFFPRTCIAGAESSGPLLVDVGGNIGMFSLAAAASCFEAIAFEPVPINAHKIMTSSRLNNMTGRLHVYTVGASDEFGFFNMGHAEHGNQGRNQGEVSLSPSARLGDVRIPMAPLQAALPLEPSGRPVFVKMDVEGGECRALRGMRAYLERANIIGMLIETGHPSTRACCSELVAPGGAFHTLRTRHRLCPRDASARAGNKAALQLDSLCQRHRWPWDMLWAPCDGAV